MPVPQESEPQQEQPGEGKRLRIDHKNVLLFINVCSIILILIISFASGSNELRIILGLPYVLFFPGYTIIAALFPKKSDLSIIERIIISFGLSIAVVPLIGLLLNYIWEIQLAPLLVMLTVLVVVMSAVSWYRGRRMSDEERLSYSVDFPLFKMKSSGKLDQAFSIVLIIAVLGIIITLIYVVVSPKAGEKFTEFYLLGLEEGADLYPSEIVFGDDGNISLVRYVHAAKVEDETRPWLSSEREVVEVMDDRARVTVGIKNRELETMSYEVRVMIGEVLYEEIGPIELAHGENWEEEVGLVPQKSEVDQKVEFKLHKIHEFGKGDDEHTLLSLWFGPEELSARVINQGQFEASYMIEIEVDDGKEMRVESVGPVTLAQGVEWEQELEFAYTGTEWQVMEFSLYRDESLLTNVGTANETTAFDGALLYKEESSALDQSLHLWIDVAEDDIEEGDIEEGEVVEGEAEEGDAEEEDVAEDDIEEGAGEESDIEEGEVVE